MRKKIQAERSSGNMFADLGLPNPEEHLAKAEIAVFAFPLFTSSRWLSALL
jgi:hypothetical protein